MADDDWKNQDDVRAPGGSNPPGWFDHPKNIKKIVKGLMIACAILVFFDLLMQFGLLGHKHGYYRFEYWPLFFGIYGFLAYTFIVLTASYMRMWLKRKEDYYDG